MKATTLERRSWRVAVGVLVTLVYLNAMAGGCAMKYGKPFDASRVQAIKKGKTTKAWVRENIGEPSTVSISGQREMWMYMYSEQRAPWEAMIPVAGPIIYATQTHELATGDTLSITFEGDVVQSYNLTKRGGK